MPAARSSSPQFTHSIASLLQTTQWYIPLLTACIIAAVQTWHYLTVPVAHSGELVIDGKTLEHVLGSPLEPVLAQLGAQCGSVVICRASPSQKAAIVRMMAEYEVSSSIPDLLYLMHHLLALFVYTW